MQDYHFRKYTIITCYAYHGIWQSNLKVKKCTVFAKYCWSVQYKVVRLGKHVPIANRESHAHTFQFHVKFM